MASFMRSDPVMRAPFFRSVTVSSSLDQCGT
jgi:hypothetical protein